MTVPTTKENEPQCPEYALRTHRAGDMGWITHRHAVLYEAEQGWGTKMEALVSKVSHDFLDNYDASCERCWIAERKNEFLGCIVLVRDRDAVQMAKLRLLLVEPSARGLGLGRALIEQCTRFARETGYVRIRLWTQSVLVSARRLYAKEGYRLVSSEKHSAFGEVHVGECWELDL
ncbi:Acyl-CoA N-acyltransferase [Penicillium sp. IBT 31633x]|nr:Acyl-CoA N-acyltransferase [Penicillium sp. IBT 31633x]